MLTSYKHGTSGYIWSKCLSLISAWTPVTSAPLNGNLIRTVTTQQTFVGFQDVLKTSSA